MQPLPNTNYIHTKMNVMITKKASSAPHYQPIVVLTKTYISCTELRPHVWMEAWWGFHSSIRNLYSLCSNESLPCFHDSPGFLIHNQVMGARNYISRRYTLPLDQIVTHIRPQGIDSICNECILQMFNFWKIQWRRPTTQQWMFLK
jgi:hypothetical protein